MRRVRRERKAGQTLGGSFQNDEGKEEGGKDDEAGAGEEAKEAFVFKAPALDLGDIFAFADEDAENKKREGAENRKDDKAKSLIGGVEVKDGVSGESEEREGEENLRKRNKETEREGLGEVVGGLGTGVDIAGEMAREPKLGGAFAFVVEEPCDNAKSDEQAKDDNIGEIWKNTGKGEDGDEEDGGAEQEKVHKGDAGDERAGELFGLLADVLAKRGVVEQKKRAERQLQRGGN